MMLLRPDPETLLGYSPTFDSFRPLDPTSCDTIWPVAVFPIFRRRDTLIAFSDVWGKSAPVFPVRLIDAYYHYMLSLNVRDAWGYRDFIQYLISTHPCAYLNYSGTQLHIVSLFHKMIRAMIRRLYEDFRNFYEEERISSTVLHRLFTYFDPSLHNVLPQVTGWRYFAAVDNSGSKIFCFCRTIGICPNFRLKYYGISELIALAMEYRPDYFSITDLGLLHNLYLRDMFDSDQIWKYFYADYLRERTVRPFEYPEGLCLVSTKEAESAHDRTGNSASLRRLQIFL